VSGCHAGGFYRKREDEMLYRKGVLSLVVLIALSHFASDFCQGSLGLIIPLLKKGMDLDYLTASLVVFLYDLGLAVFPVIMGSISDRFSNNVLLPAGCFFSGAGLFVTCFSHSLTGVFLGVLLAGIGLAASHSEGAKQVYLIGYSRSGLSMSLFALGGNAGFSIAPIIAGLIAVKYGRPGLAVMTVPAFLTGILIMVFSGMLNRYARNATSRYNSQFHEGSPTENLWRPLTVLSLFVVLRSGIHHSLSMLVPLYVVEFFHLNSMAAGFVVSIYLLVGIFASPLGGFIAETAGERKMLVASLLVSCPLLFLLPYVPYRVMLVFLFILGTFIMSTFGLTPALAQLYVPARPGTAVGIANGLAVGIGGGLGVLLVGYLSNLFGLRCGLSILTLMALGGVAAASLLPGLKLNKDVRHPDCSGVKSPRSC
jgi:FSR family fosmidomycin resistance protein-like MFS transporter